MHIIVIIVILYNFLIVLLIIYMFCKFIYICIYIFYFNFKNIYYALKINKSIKLIRLGNFLANMCKIVLLRERKAPNYLKLLSAFQKRV